MRIQSISDCQNSHEYEKDSGAGFNPQFDYKKKMRPFYLMVGGEALQQDDQLVMVFFERVKE